MRIFLSYGHDQNAPLVERIGGDLKIAGHEVWIDQSEIKAGEDWRRSIVDGLSDTDWVLGFLSKHSTRDPGVCLDELAIALHVRGGAIATVLVEGESAVEPPVSVSHIQWRDMHDWAERETAGGANWENWYRAKLDEILNLLASPVTQRFAGEIEELDRRLKPIAQEADIGLLVDGFVGREWLRTALDEWRRHSMDSRLFWLSGAAGTGKSAFAAWLAHRGKVNVIGLNLCRYNIDDRRDPARVIRTLTFQIATRLPDYRRLLLDKLTVQDPGGDDLARKGPGDLFGFLLIETLRLAIDGVRREDRYLIVIDGLDETVRDGRSELAEILAEQAKKLPAWLAMLVTSRPEEPILRQFGEFQPHWIKAESPENLSDVRMYACEWLATLDLPQSEAPALIDSVLAASEGNFLYLRMLREAVTTGTLSLIAPEGLPHGLIGLYERWFRRQFPDRQAYEAYVPVLAVLAAAEHPVPESWLSRMFGWSKREEARMLEGLGSLFERRPDGVVPFHKSLRDWLIDPRSAGADFVVEEAEGTRRLAVTLWAEFIRWASASSAIRSHTSRTRWLRRRSWRYQRMTTQPEDGGDLDPFCVIELPAQIARSRAGDIKALLANSSPWPAIRPGLFRTAESQAQNFAWETALGWWRSTAILANTSGDKALPDQAAALAKTGDILITLGRHAAALTSYQASFSISDWLVKADPGNAEWQASLSLSHDRIGDVQRAQGDLPAALTSYQASFAISERLAKADPGNVVWQLGLSVSQGKIGDVQSAQGDLAAALNSYQASLAISERLAKADPGDAGWQRGFSVSQVKIGDGQVAQGDLAAALTSYQASLAISERLAKADPGNARWQHDLSVFQGRIGDVQNLQGDLEAALTNYQASLAISERLAKADPGNADWQLALSVSQVRIGDVQNLQGDLAAALTSYQASLAIRDRLAKADPGNAGWQHDLSVSQGRIGDVQSAQGDLAAALTSYQASLAIRDRLAKADPGNARWQRDLALSHSRIDGTVRRMDDLARRDALLDELRKLARDFPDDAAVREQLLAFQNS